MNIAIILAGGIGSRIGTEIPKQFVELSGRMMIVHSMLPFGESAYVNNLQIVAAKQWREKIENAVESESVISEKILGFSDPGDNRQLSIYNALKDIEKMGLGDMVDNIIIHDAARPFVSKEMIEDCFKALETHGGAMPVLPMNDTVYFSHTGTKVDELLDRNTIFAGQAPEAFRYKEYLAANEALLPDKIMMIKGSTEPAVMAGMDVAMIPGDQRNFKVTNKVDLELAEEMLRESF